VNDRRVLILGNSGSGKTTAARELGLPHLDLDSVAWSEPGIRAPLAESEAAILAFHNAHPSWVMEGSYASLAEIAAPLCTEFRFLNPGVETCLAHCRQRPWEPEKYDSPEAQDERLAFLLDWVRSYDSREDEYGLAAHRAVFDAFGGPKREVTASGAARQTPPRQRPREEGRG